MGDIEILMQEERSVVQSLWRSIFCAKCDAPPTALSSKVIELLA
jgi:hypothetical protein